ncbi:TPA: M10 family metallopeptidase [Yersinia enterocolitica]|uniref:M10 family metallopeptidase C-terminal domain-containing protein n=1 Tax=Yersinia enterocolitica TaxID=630 RepID=UPI0029AB848D|nr:M10 family metallopeptidase [Yersinia enterocolitica]HDM8437382.1 M10 family metallopeptidase [Yersinia enterocolitica]HEI6851931.1 M10 family metallopeptidase [Yersinia enterocolitica]HEN3580141.1 M10 family metallopeptidase [Yersinia enterocolitica]HEN3602308.1 M10 family metallopeptidase [Yersinia enterocolitica]
MNYRQPHSEYIKNTIYDYTWNGYQVYNHPAELTFSFNHNHLIWDNDIPYQDGALTFSFNELQQCQANIAMQSWSDVANVSFTEGQANSAVNLSFKNYQNEKSAISGYAYYPNTIKFTPIWINYNASDHQNSDTLNYSGRVLIHEIGHSLGLRHTHDNDYTEQTSVMSYLPAYESGANYRGHYASTPQMYDIAAIQYLYGANMHTHTGNTVYGFNSNSQRDYFTANTADAPLIFCVWDAAGNDTFDFSGYQQDQLLNLNAGDFSNIGGLTGNVSIAYGVVIENAIGGSGNDKIIGNSVDNILTGNGGCDQLWGKGGSNIFRYQSSKDSMTTAADTIHDFKVDKDRIDLSPLIYSTDDITLVDRFNFSDRTVIAQKYNEVSDITYLMIDFDNNVHETDMLIKLTGRHQLSLNNFIVSSPLIA